MSAGCDEDLAGSLKSGTATAGDISIGAKYEYVLVRRRDSTPERWFVRPLTRAGGGRCSSLAAQTVIPPPEIVAATELKP